MITVSHPMTSGKRVQIRVRTKSSAESESVPNLKHTVVLGEIKGEAGKIGLLVGEEGWNFGAQTMEELEGDLSTEHPNCPPYKTCRFPS